MAEFMQSYVPKETEVVSSCLRYLNSAGIFAWRSNNMGTARKRRGKTFYTFNGVRGVSDILGVILESSSEYSGKILCVECKRAGKLDNQSEEQKDFEEQIKKNKGIYLLVDSWSMLETELKKLGIVE